MASLIQLKRSAVADQIPLVTDLTEGELAINVLSGRLYTRDNANNVVNVSEDLAALQVDDTLNVDGAVTFSDSLQVDGSITSTVDIVADTAAKWATARSITLTGDATGSVAAIDGSANVSAAVTVVAGDVDTAAKWLTPRTITLGGDLSGAVAIDGSANVSLTATVADDSHSHTIANVDGLQGELDRDPTNIIINGDFKINQRGGTKTPSVGVYGYDRWKGYAGSKLEQVIEWRYAGGTYTLSWAGGGTGILNGTSGTSPITATIPTDTNFSVVVPSAAVKVQCQAGSVATDYTARPKGEEFALCQRYYWATDATYFPRMTVRNSGDLDRSVHFVFPVRMRTTPTITLDYGGLTAAPTLIASKHGFTADGTSTMASSNSSVNNVKADAEL